MLVEHDELTREGAAHVEVGGEGLEALVVAEDLAGGCGGHRGHHERVSHAVLDDFVLELVPVPAAAVLVHAPEVELQLALAGRRAGETRVRAFGLGRVKRGAAGGVVDGLEDFLVELASGVALEGEVEHRKGVGKTLHAEADGAVAHVGVVRFFDRVVVHVDDAVEVPRRVVGHVVEEVVVERALVHVHEAGQRDGGKVAHGDLVLGGVLDDLGAQVGRADGPEVLLVGLRVGGVLVEHVRGAGLDLCFDDLVPHVTSRHRLAGEALGFVRGVKRLKLGTVHVLKAWALVRAEEGPVRVGFNPLHEQVGRPHGVEEVASAHLFLPVVLAQVEEFEQVRVPRFEVDGNRTLALAAALVNVARRVVEDAQHGDDAVRGAVGPLDVGALGANVVDGKANATGRLGDHRALLERVVDAVQRVILHGQQEARRHLRHRGARVEQRRRGVSEVALRHQVVGAKRAVDVLVVDAHGHAHEHVLGALGHLAVEAKQVGALERLEAEVVVIVIAAVVDVPVEALRVGHNDGVHIFRNERRVLAGLRVNEGPQVVDDFREIVLGGAVQVVDANACRQARVIRVVRSERCGGLRSELVELAGLDAVVKALDGGLGDQVNVHPTGVQTFGQSRQLFLDRVEANVLPFAVSVDDLHCHD